MHTIVSENGMIITATHLAAHSAANRFTQGSPR